MAYSREKALETAQRYVAKGQFEKAAAAYRTILGQEPGDLRIALRLADALLRAGQEDEAVDCFLRVGHAYEEAEDPAKALAVYRQAASAQPARSDLMYKCAELYSALGRTAEAVETYERIAQVHLQQGESDHALSIYAHVVQIEPRSVSRRLRLAELYSREQRTKEAVETFRQACVLLLQAEDYPQYIRVAERLLYHEDIDEVTRELVRVYLAVKQPRRALVKLNALLQKNHADFEGLELLADTFLSLGRKQKGLSVILELARAAQGQGLAAQEAASRAVLRGLDEMPDNAELLRIGTELSESLPAEAGPDDVLDAVSQQTALAQLQASEAALTQSGAMLDGIDKGQLAGLGLDLEPVVQEEQQVAQSTALPPSVQRAVEEARVLTKFELLEHARAQLAPHKDLYGDDPVVCEAQAQILAASGDADAAYKLRLGAAQRLSAQRQRSAVEQIATAILKDHPGDKDAEALLLEAQSQVAQDRFDAAQTSNFQAVVPTSTGVSTPDPAPGPGFELEIDLGPLSARPAQMSSDPPLDIGETQPAELPDIGETQPADSTPDLGLAMQAGLGGSRVAAEPPGAPRPAARFQVSGLETPATPPQADAPSPQESSRRTQAHPQLAPPPTRSGRTRSTLPPKLRPANVVPQDNASPPAESVESRLKETQAAPAVGAQPQAARVPQSPEQAAQAQDAQALGAWGVAQNPGQSLPSGDHGSIFDEQPPTGDEHVSGLESPLAVEEIEEIDDFEEIEEIEEFEVEELEDELEEIPSEPKFAPQPGAQAASAIESMGASPSEEEINELRFYLQEQLQDEANELFADLRVRFGDTHPSLSPYFVHFGEAPPQQQLSARTPGLAAEPLLSEDEADAALSALSAFSDSSADVQAEVYDEEPSKSGQRSPQARFDMALAYRDMGLAPNAIAELNACLRTAELRVRAALMLGQLERERGQLEASQVQLRRAMEWASTPDESRDARYELGLTLEQMSKPEEARRCWAELPPAYRDVRQRLARIG